MFVGLDPGESRGKERGIKGNTEENQNDTEGEKERPE